MSRALSSSITSFGLRAVRVRTRAWAARSCRPTTVSMSGPAIGLCWRRAPRSSRFTSIVVVSSSACAVVWCGESASIDESPNMSPGPGESTTTSWLSSSTIETCTLPRRTTYAFAPASPAR